MTIEHSIIYGLIGFVVIQQLFYMWQVNKLLNKATSRNYAEYIQAENLKKPVVHKVSVPDFKDEFDVNVSLR